MIFAFLAVDPAETAKQAQEQPLAPLRLPGGISRRRRRG